MRLADLPEVSGIDGIGVYKFLVANVRLRSGGDEKRRVIRAAKFDARLPEDEQLMHRHLHAHLFEEEGKSAYHQNSGGGLLDVRDDHICVYGRSGSYGKEPDRHETIAVLQRAFPDLRIIQR